MQQSDSLADPILRDLEAESIEIIREAYHAAKAPVLLYSIGKDSSVLLSLCERAFAPGPLPFRVMHIDTTFKFRAMIAFRDRIAAEHGLDLVVYTNQEGVREGINPFDHGQHYTEVMKTKALKQALDEFGFDVIFGGARRDEEASRAKERVFSLRRPGHVWDPRDQQPEFWTNYNTQIPAGNTLRVFPLSNWTELQIWRYIQLNNIPVVELYFAKERPVVQRGGQWIMVDDDRMRLKADEVPQIRKVRFRTLGCYPLTAGFESDADSIEALISEVASTRASERVGRLIDHDAPSSMEQKKRGGYF